AQRAVVRRQGARAVKRQVLVGDGAVRDGRGGRVTVVVVGGEVAGRQRVGDQGRRAERVGAHVVDGAPRRGGRTTRHARAQAAGVVDVPPLGRAVGQGEGAVGVGDHGGRDARPVELALQNGFAAVVVGVGRQVA